MQVTSGTNAFPQASEIADVPGAENWRSMYRYYTRFQPEDDDRFWFYKATFSLSRQPCFRDG
jgi:pyruvate, water dikinase